MFKCFKLPVVIILHTELKEVISNSTTSLLSIDDVAHAVFSSRTTMIVFFSEYVQQWNYWWQNLFDKLLESVRTHIMILMVIFFDMFFSLIKEINLGDFVGGLIVICGS